MKCFYVCQKCGLVIECPRPDDMGMVWCGRCMEFTQYNILRLFEDYPAHNIKADDNPEE